jgi:hypothetical protein
MDKLKFCIENENAICELGTITVCVPFDSTMVIFRSALQISATPERSASARPNEVSPSAPVIMQAPCHEDLFKTTKVVCPFLLLYFSCFPSYLSTALNFHPYDTHTTGYLYHVFLAA